ncbi:unnamed protein product [Cuscuta europaea]|uniref:Uncharacterized protein n=1 Tax=Cuscuta europaea TaxID=41803 RepID=A0A9P0ZVU9_CUSEU|nr:unnamed protein product [Cuscuta europaea]
MLQDLNTSTSSLLSTWLNGNDLKFIFMSLKLFAFPQRRFWWESHLSQNVESFIKNSHNISDFSLVFVSFKVNYFSLFFVFDFIKYNTAAKVNVQDRLPIAKNLQVIKLHDFSFAHTSCFTLVIELLRKCPKLRELEISMIKPQVVISNNYPTFLVIQI